MHTTSEYEPESGEDAAENTSPFSETTEQDNLLIAPPEGEQIDLFE